MTTGLVVNDNHLGSDDRSAGPIEHEPVNSSIWRLREGRAEKKKAGGKKKSNVTHSHATSPVGGEFIQAVWSTQETAQLYHRALKNCDDRFPTVGSPTRSFLETIPNFRSLVTTERQMCLLATILTARRISL